MASTHHSNGADNGAHAAVATPQQVTSDLLGRYRTRGGLFRLMVVVTGILFLLGVVGFLMRALTEGFNDASDWGYLAATYSFVLTTVQAAPMLAIAVSLTRAHWARPVSRAAELWAGVAVIGVLLYLPLLFVLPSLEDGRRSFWFFEPGGDVPAYSAHIWSSVAYVALLTAGVMMLWVSALPDLAYVRDHATGWQQRWAARLSGRWRGTSYQWFMQKHRLGILNAFYFIALITMHYFLTTDFLMTLIPGWIDALFPATHAHNALQAGLATVVVTAFFLRNYGGYKHYIGLDQMWAMGKLLFAISLLWVWFWFSSFNVLWYGKKPNEQAALELLMTGPYLPLFYASFTLNFLVPFLVLVSNPVRKSTWGPPLIAVGVLFGMLFDQIRLFVAAYSVPGIGDPTVDKHGTLAVIPPTIYPGLADILMMVGTIGGAVLLFLVLSRIIPVVSMWRMRELMLYKQHKPFHRTQVLVLGKPE